MHTTLLLHYPISQTLWIITEYFNPTQPNTLHTCLYMYVKKLEPPRQKVLSNIANVNFAPRNAGNPKSEYYILKLTCSCEIHWSIKCLFNEIPYMSFLWMTVPIYLPFSKYDLVSPKIYLRLKPSYLWDGERIGKNLTQFFQELFLNSWKCI